jgi:hypothetical protein
MRAVVPERLNCTRFVPEENEVFAGELEANWLLPADVVRWDGRVPIFLKAERWNRASSVVGVVRLNERRRCVLLAVTPGELPPAARPATANFV